MHNRAASEASIILLGLYSSDKFEIKYKFQYRKMIAKLTFAAKFVLSVRELNATRIKHLKKNKKTLSHKMMLS